MSEIKNGYFAENEEKIHWWGYCNTRGWVFLDRTINRNKPNNYEDLLFIDCTTGEAFYTKRSNWCAPDFLASGRYLKSISSEMAEIESRYLKGFKLRIGEYKSTIIDNIHNDKNHHTKEPNKNTLFITHQEHQNQAIKKSGNDGFPYIKAAIAIALVIAFISWSNRNKPCSEAYADAWAECNSDYNGKCRYLGPRYEPKSCIPDYKD